ncbi:response regulator transcription factor [Patulibacter americanus]|uniref:response regulator transcription factor n=1 Tax=Patulibacter americanus TaxID=588672 RepID=UPI0003B62539|nr:response regulator transcription factor [Patulibacter americanus]
MRVLVLEDNPQLGPAVAAGLRDAAFAVDLARDLAAARRRLVVHEYDALVADRGLPDGDGLSLLADLRADGSPLPTLVLTALDGVDQRVEGFEHGADDYLVKPFAMVELVARVRALVRRGTVARPTITTVGDLVIDVPRHRVTRGGILLSLTAKEFSVLEVLAERPGDVVSRTTLIERCWDELSEPMSNVVDVLIGQLRRRLGAPDPIETVRGVGYRLAVAGDA